MFSKTCEYALRAILHISIYGSEEVKLGLKEISEGLHLPSPFLSKILQQLVRHHFIQSAKGPGGGFYISSLAAKTPLINIIETLDGLGHFSRCGLGLKQCSEKKPCPIHHEFKAYREKLRLVFEHKTVAELSLIVKEGQAFICN